MKKRFFLLVALLAVSCGQEPQPEPTPVSQDELKITSQSSFTLQAEGGSVTVQFTSSGNWTAALSNDRASGWLSLSATSGEKGNASLTLTAEKSEETDERNATVRLTCGKASATVTVVQKQKDALTQTPSKTEFDAEGGSFTILVKSNIDYTFEIDGSDWIHKGSTKAMTEKTTTFSVDANTDTRKREGSVTVVSSLGREKVSIYQAAAAPSIVLTSNQVAVATEGGSFNVEISANVDVSMSITAGTGWLSETGTKATSTHTYSFSASANESTDARIGEITFSNSEYGLSEKVTVTQMQKDALVIANTLYEIGAEGGDISIEATANVDPAITVSESWVHQVSTKAMTTRTFDFTVDANPGTDVRECNITFSGREVEAPDSPWSLIGTMGGDNWAKDIVMKIYGEWQVALNMTFTSTDEFKFRKDKDWAVNFGSNSYSVTTLPGNCVAYLAQEGGNLKIVAGTYDIYLSADKKQAYFLAAGTPFNQDGYAVPAGTVSQTVVIRQDGADGFIADFQEEYTLSARSQTLDLRSRSSVDIDAESKSDWIHVVKTKALQDKSVTLQIDENTAENSRTGKVTISAPSLGESKEVTITQVGSGNIYMPDDNFRALMISLFDKDGDGALSIEECEAVNQISLNAQQTASVNQIESLQGIEYFTNLTSLMIQTMDLDGFPGKLKGTLDLKANTKLYDLNLGGCSQMDVLDISNCDNLRYLNVVYANSLKEIIFPGKTGQNLISIGLSASKLGPELDLSIYPDLSFVSLRDNPNLKTVWLMTGLAPQSLSLDDGVTVKYKGDNLNAEAPFKDPVFKEMLMNSDYYKNFDSNGDGVFSVRELEKLMSINIWPEYFNGMDESKVITSFEDLALMKNINAFMMSDLHGRVTAPLPDCLGELPDIDRIIIMNTDITGPIPESVCSMEKLLYLDIENTQISGPLPKGIGNIPILKQLKITGCPNFGGTIPESLLTGPGYDEINLSGCNFDDTFIVLPSSRLIDHTLRSNNFSFLGSQTRDYSLAGGGTYQEYPSIYYRSEADGHGTVHADGEVVLYNAATKGPGLDIFITGDGFTAENNTVGGTLETYMKYIADVTLSMEPYNKLKEYFNVWLIYAHSQREGTGFNSTEGLRFGSYQPNPGSSTRCDGNFDAICNFVKEATGRNETSGTVAVIMNSSQYGGTLYFNNNPMYEAGMTVGYTAAAWTMALTYVHETLGHGFAHLDDEYDANGYSGGYYSYMGSSWATNGFGANVDAEQPVRWSSFIDDTRYAGEKIGAYATPKKIQSYFGPGGLRDYYRPTENSIMNTQWEEGGNRFNAPSREAIWQRVQILAHPEKNWSSWEDYVTNGYDREEFVEFDLSPAPSSAGSQALRLAKRPVQITRDGIKAKQLPAHTPPVILNRSN